MNILCSWFGHKPIAGRESWKGKEKGNLRIRYKDVFCGRCGTPLDRITKQVLEEEKK